MEEYLSLNRSELQIKLPDQEVRISQVICLAMMAGVIVFSVIILYMHSVMNTEDYYFNPENSISPLLAKLLIIIGLIMYSLIYIIPKFLFNPEGIKNRLSGYVVTNQGDPQTDSISKLIYLHRTYMLIQIAVLEFVALFGLVILFLSIQEGVIYANSDYWLLLTPLVIMILFIIKNFPTKQKMAEQIENNILNPLRTITK